jgi:hypothetical protein
MTCRSLADAIVDVARGRDAGRGTIAAVEAHVEQCAPCASRLARERQLSEGLRALAAATASAVPSAAVEERLMAALSAQQPSRAPGWLAPAAAAAAVLAAVVWWTSPHGTRAPVQSPARHPEPVSTRPAETGTPTVSHDELASHRVPQAWAQVDATVSRRMQGRLTSSPRRAASEGGFITLPAAVGLPDFESGVIVRMELPQSALPAYGLEIFPESKTPVEADLLIGQDGQARAIRLVNRSLTRPGAEQ